MKHYIIVEVRERNDHEYGITDAGLIRKNLHKFCEERGINAADACIREDREWLHPLMQESGYPRERNPYHMAKQLFVKAMGPHWRKMKAERDDEITHDGKWMI